MLYSVKRFQIFDCRFTIEKKPAMGISIANLKSKIANSPLPTRFHHAGNLSLQRQLAKANPAQMKLAQISARTAAPFTTGVRPGRKFRLAIRFRD
jgi:predicted FMN-binding regulatory protein PaiB